MRAWAGLVSFATAVLLAAAQLGASCVDGVTPDCSDAAVCAPSPGNAPGDGSVVLPEASSDAGTSTGTDAEAGLDTDADGG